MKPNAIEIERATTQQKLDFFLQTWRDVFVEAKETPEATISRYFTEDYQFYVNGHLLDFDDMVSRARRMRQEIARADLTVLESVGEGHKLAEIHQVEVVTEDGAKSTVRLHNFLEFSGNKIKRVQSLTMNIGGDERHADIASRH